MYKELTEKEIRDMRHIVYDDVENMKIVELDTALTLEEAEKKLNELLKENEGKALYIRRTDEPM